MVSSTGLYTLYKDDYQFWDGVVTLTVATRRHTNDGGDKSDSVAYCKPTPLDRARRVFGDINVNVDDSAYVIPHVLLTNINAASQQLRQGDKLTDAASNEYIIQHATLARFGTQWIVTCNRRK